MWIRLRSTRPSIAGELVVNLSARESQDQVLDRSDFHRFTFISQPCLGNTLYSTHLWCTTRESRGGCGVARRLTSDRVTT
jgi:hypothetical protein